MDKDLRNAIERATQRARQVLEEDFAEQLEGDYDVMRSGRVGDKPGSHLDGGRKTLRIRLVAAVEHKRLSGMAPSDAVKDYLREAAFTTLNRFVALKMLEARDLVQECITRGDASAGFTEFCGLAPGVKFPDGSGYRLYIESIFDELSTEVKVLFDRRDPASALWPRRAAFEELLRVLNADELKTAWSEDETIGWVYQYFNSGEERRQMREESQAPRNGRELAVRNQFFTPRYVVQFLTDNTLGRIWYEMRKGKTSLATLCEYMVRRPGETFAEEGENVSPEKVLEGLTQDELWRYPMRIPHRSKKDPRDLRILDPACGSGHFLLYCFVLLLAIYEEAWADITSPASDVTGRTLRDDFPSVDDLRLALPGLVLRHNLHGIDIDPRCAQIAQLALWMRAQRAYREFGVGRAERPVIRRVNIVIAEPMPGEKELLTEFLRWLKEDRLEALLQRALDIPPGSSVKATKAMADSLAELVTTVWHGMKLAGEMGALLKIEHDLTRAIEKGRNEWEDRLPLFRISEYGLDGDPKEKLDRVVPGEQHDFWTKAERLVFQALSDYVGAVNGVGAARRRLFVEDATQGFAFTDLITKRFDVILMNPPFGLPSESCKEYYDSQYILNRTDIYGAFIMRGISLLEKDGRLGVISPRSFLYQVTFEPMRRSLFELGVTPQYVIEMGLGVLDSATVRVALSVFARNSVSCSYANFTSYEKDDEHFRSAYGTGCWNIQSVSEIQTLPAVAFLFGLSAELKRYLRTENVRLSAWNGLQTCDDFRFVRLSSEVWNSTPENWAPFLKPTFFAPYTGVQCTFVNWKASGREIKAMISQRGESPSRYCNNENRYPATDAWYPDVSERGIGVCVVSTPAIPSRTGIALSKPASLSRGALVAYANSLVVEGLVGLVTPDRHHKPTYLAAAPVPSELSSVSDDLDRMVAELIEQIPSFGPLDGKYIEPFLVIAGRREGVLSLDDAVKLLTLRCNEVRRLQAAIDQKVLTTLRLSEEDTKVLHQTSQRVDPASWFPHFSQSDARASLAEEWFVHETLLVLQNSIPGICPADDGHSEDIVPLLERALCSRVDIEGTALFSDALLALGVPSLREYVQRSDGLYSAFRRLFTASQRRGVPIIQLSTNSGSYAVWIDFRRASRDSFFRVQNDYLVPKFSHEQRQLDALRGEAGPNPTNPQRKAIEAQEAFVEELQAFLDEVKRVAPLWDPDLNDGVIINFAPLWRLVPQNRAWQKELRSTWDALVSGDYDWSHLAMRFWPERVVPKCTTDRSLAIAHGVEDIFWFENEDKKWKPQKKPTRSVDEIVKERTSPAVKEALRSLMEAPDATGTSKRGRKRAA